jgi:hypothetical protein
MGLPPADFDARNFATIQPDATHHSKPAPMQDARRDSNDSGERGWSKQSTGRGATSTSMSPANSKRASMAVKFGNEGQDDWRSRIAEIVSSNLFQNTTLFVIVLNGLWIGIDIEWNHPNLKGNDGKLPLEPTSTVVENCFCTYFTLEILVRLVCYRSLKHMVQDLWLLFDGVLVLFMVIETWILPIVELIVGISGGGILSQFSVLRLLRLTRLTRIMNSLPELLTLVKGIANAARAVFAVLCFLILIMYVFSIVFTGQLGDAKAPELKMEPYWERGDDPTGQELFGSIGDSMMTLFTRGTLGDNLAETLTAIKDLGGDWTCETDDDGNESCGRSGGSLWLMWVFILFMILSAFCILNMLVGILCEVIQSTAEEENEKNMLAELRFNIEESFRSIDVSGDDVVTYPEWNLMRNEETVRSCFLKLGIESEDLDLRLDQIGECLFGVLSKDRMIKKNLNGSTSLRLERTTSENEEEYGIKLEDFMNTLLETRPDAPASFLDVEIMRSRILATQQTFGTQLGAIEKVLTEVQKNLCGPDASLGATSEVPALLNEGSDETAQAADGHRDIVPEEWLQSLSNDVIFEELRERRLSKSDKAAIDLY